MEEEEQEEKSIESGKEYACKLIFDTEGEETRVCGVTVKKADILKVCLSRIGNVMGVTLKDKGDLWA